MNYQTQKAIEALKPQIKSIIKDMIGDKPVGQIALQAKYKTSVRALINVFNHCGYDADGIVKQWKIKRGIKSKRSYKIKMTGSDQDEKAASIPNQLPRTLWV